MQSSLSRLGASALLASVFVVLVGCASSAVLVGKARPAISPDQVKLYLRPPAQYEDVALLEASSKGSFAITDQGKTDAVIERMKVEAAKLGANGILLQGTGSEVVGFVSPGAATTNFSGGAARTTGFTTSVGIRQKAGNGIAIYVLWE